jgi:acetyl esterase/lipase
MAYTLDSEIAAIMASVAPNMRMAARGDWKALREIATAMSAQMMTSIPPDSNVRIKSFFTKTKDNAEIELRWYTKLSTSAGPAIVYAHGGGMILGSAEMYDSIVAEYVTLTGVPFLSVNYRLAPEVKGTTLVEDTFAGLSWLFAHASELGVNAARIAIMGDSAGGGVAAGTAILARDRGVPLAKQILIYPMLDDRNVSPDPSLELHATWTYDNNFTGWSALLGSEIGSQAVSPLAAPARLKDFAGLAPAYIEVGELDIFRDESISYAQRIAAAGTPLELHVHPGAPHGFDRMAPQSQLTRRAFADRTRVISGL